MKLAVTLFLVISDKVSPSPVGCAAAAIHLILSSAFSFSSPVADQLPYIIIGQKEKCVCWFQNNGWGERIESESIVEESEQMEKHV